MGKWNIPHQTQIKKFTEKQRISQTQQNNYQKNQFIAAKIKSEHGIDLLDFWLNDDDKLTSTGNRFTRKTVLMCAVQTEKGKRFSEFAFVDEVKTNFMLNYEQIKDSADKHRKKILKMLKKHNIVEIDVRDVYSAETTKITINTKKGFELGKINGEFIIPNQN